MDACVEQIQPSAVKCIEIIELLSNRSNVRLLLALLNFLISFGYKGDRLRSAIIYSVFEPAKILFHFIQNSSNVGACST